MGNFEEAFVEASRQGSTFFGLANRCAILYT
jgi:hypothetical protein